MKLLAISERRACKVLGQHRSTQRKKPTKQATDAALTEAITALAEYYGRYGYRMIAGLLRLEGWFVNHKRVERIWRREGLKIPKQQPKRGRLWMNDGSCIRLRLPIATTDLKIHDLRHTYASILISKGHDLPLIGSLLGHTQVQTTQRYAHLMDEPQRDATNQVGNLIDV